MTRGSQFLRQWKALSILSARRFGCSLEDLAEELGYHARTLRRDLEVLESAGFLLERKRDPVTRRILVGLPPSSRVPAIPFTLTELLSLHFSGSLLSGLKGNPFHEGMTSALEKIGKSLPVRALDYLFLRRNTLLFKHGPAKDYSAHTATIETIQQAIAERRKMDLHYLAYGRTRADPHVFLPWCMTFAEGTFYLVGYSETRKARRILAVDRIRSARLLEATFEPPEDFDPEEFLKEGFGIYHEGKTYRVRIEFTKGEAQFIRERTWHPTQKIETLRDGRVILTMQVAGLMDVSRWVLSYGKDAKALEPPELVRQVREHLKAGGARYS